MKIKIDIFSGFLGAGKTRLIKKLIEGKYYENEFIAIIENEFGEVSIDGAILKSTNTIVEEINAGCICCQVNGDFKKSVLEIIEKYNVTKLIIEPTGIAKLSDLKKTFEENEFKDIVEIDNLITVIDCEKFDVYLSNFRNFYIDQIKSANKIILSRVQKVDVKSLDNVTDKLKKLNNKADMSVSNWETTEAKEIMNSNYEKVWNIKNTLTINKSKVLGSKKEKDASKFQTFAIKINKDMCKEELLNKIEFLKNNKSYGDIVRAKGFLNSKDGKANQFDLTLSDFSIQNINYDGDNVISFIGINLNKDEIIKFFK